MFANPKVRAPIAIVLGAVVGALCRYYADQWLSGLIDSMFPIGTFLVNLSGCFLIGLVTTLAVSQIALTPDLLLLVTTGFLGSYTTFSTYELDSGNLLEVNRLYALLYWLGSPLLGMLCFGLGVALIVYLIPPNASS